MPAVDSLTGSIVRAFKANAQMVALLPGGLWEGEVPETTLLPFGVIANVQETVDWTSGSPYLETNQLEVAVYAKTLAAAEAIARPLDDYLQFFRLTFTDAKIVAVYREGYRPEPNELRAPSGEIVYGIVSPYRVIVQRSRN